MAFSLDAGVGDSTTSLNDGNPFWLESAEGLSGANIVRYEQRSPLQLGATDLGYRLAPRVMTLNLLFYATTDAALDTHRQTLMDVFKPLTDTSIFLTVTRDDDETRRLTCFAVGDIAIALVPEHRPGHLHRATVKLRAANPLWVNQTVNQSSFAGTATSDWWLAGGQIGTANVMEHTEFPTQGQAWTYAGTLTGSWSIAFRSAQEPGVGTPVAFHAGTAPLFSALFSDARFWWRGSGFDVVVRGFPGAGSLASGTQNYMLVQDSFTTNHEVYYGGTQSLVSEFADVNISGTTRRWRSDRMGSASTYWTSELPKVAIYNIALSSAQRIALDTYMAGTPIQGTINAVNSGDVPSYPYITLQGPLENPILTNTTTGAILDLSGVRVGSTDTYRVDLRDGNKQITDSNGSNKLGDLSDPLSLTRWNLAPAPIATGGTNVIRVQGGSITTNTRVTIEHYDQYMSF